MTKGISLADLDARKASDNPFEDEYFGPDGEATGIFFSVLGAESPTVVEETQKMINERRRKEAAAELRARTGGRKSDVVFVPIEDDIQFGQRLTAVRMVGWRGITEEFTPERALELIQSNQHIANWIAERSGDMTNFTKTSPKI